MLNDSPNSSTNNRTLISDICNKVSSYLDKEQIKQIYAAYLLAAQAHDGQYRKSGEAYVFHPLSVAMILVDLKVDFGSIIAAILHDLIEDTNITKIDIKKQFGSEIAHIVDGISKLDGLENKSISEKQAKNFRKLLLAASKDIRVIVIKLADRLHNMRTIDVMNRDSQLRIAKETEDVYIPISRRIGLGKITKELKTLVFKTIYPMRYKTLSLKLQAKYNKNHHLLRDAINLFTKQVKNNVIDANIIGRKKDLVSIYHKMRDKKLKFSEVLDLYGLRIIVNDVASCYRILGIVHNACKPVPGSFKDYIALPKNNGYQSLHTVIFGRNRQTIEVQIRTTEMDDIASYGIASHWYYKNNHNDRVSVKWIDSLTANKEDSDEVFLDKVRAEMSKDDIFVFTPNGDIIKLPYESTALDFAYALHTDIGNKTYKIKIDNINFALNTKIKSGQTIEVITNNTTKVKIKWLDIVTTIKAKSAIKQELKTNSKKDLMHFGKELLIDFLYYNGIDINKISDWSVCVNNLSIKNKQTLFIKIALKEVLLSKIIEALSNYSMPSIEIVSGLTENSQNIKTSCAKCCYPIPGDKVLGILGTSKGLQIHRSNCINIKNKDTSLIEWHSDKFEIFNARITCDVGRKRGALASIVSLISKMKINILDIEVKEESNSSLIDFVISINNLITLNQLINKLNDADFIKKVSRYKS